jgi:nucleoside-diphosphate-sugar epimerase
MGVDPDPVILANSTMEIRDQTLDTTKARQQLDWRPTWELDRGLQETVAWYRKHLMGSASNGFVRC